MCGVRFVKLNGLRKICCSKLSTTHAARCPRRYLPNNGLCLVNGVQTQICVFFRYVSRFFGNLTITTALYFVVSTGMVYKERGIKVIDLLEKRLKPTFSIFRVDNIPFFPDPIKFLQNNRVYLRL